MTISIQISDGVLPALLAAPAKVQEAVIKVVSDTTNTAYQRIKTRTPRDRGEAAAGWSVRKQGDQAFVENSVPHITVLEYGSFPVIPLWKKRSKGGGIRRGNAWIGGSYPPGPRTVRAGSGEPKMAEGNVSRQAPSGMVRLTLAEIEPEFAFNLEEAIEAALNSDAGEDEASFGGKA